MPNPEDTSSDSRNAKKPTPLELKKELEKVIKPILNEDGYAVQERNKVICILSSLKEKNAREYETIEEAIRFVSSLGELKIKESAVPKESMSGEIMGHPVVVASGQLSQARNVGIVIRDGHSNDIGVAKEKKKLGGKCKGKEKVTFKSRGRENAIQVTYNCPSNEECFPQGHKTRRKTKQELTNSLLTPDNLLKNIEQWRCPERCIDPPKPLHEINEAATRITWHDRGRLDSLLDNMMSSSLSDQRSSAKTLRQLTKQYPLFRDLFGNDEAVSKLLKPLDVLGNACLDLDLQLDIITTLFNISLPQGNKKVVAENLRVIPLLINALRTSTSQTKSNAAAALFNLSELDSNRNLIHESSALGPLIRLVKEGNSETMTDVCTAMYMLCWEGANTVAHREKAVSDGAVRVILRKVKDGAFLDLLLPVLATFSSLPSAAEEMRKMGAVACLLKIMERGDKDSNAVKSCAAILRNICSYDKDELKEVKQEGAADGTISSVALRGTQKGRKKRHWIM